MNAFKIEKTLPLNPPGGLNCILYCNVAQYLFACKIIDIL